VDGQLLGLVRRAQDVSTQSVPIPLLQIMLSVVHEWWAAQGGSSRIPISYRPPKTSPTSGTYDGTSPGFSDTRTTQRKL
jgi:hypothetical protein